MTHEPDSFAIGEGPAPRKRSSFRNILRSLGGSIALGVTSLLATAGSASAQAPPASFTANFTNGGNTVTVNFSLHPIRSSNFSVIIQNSSGGFDPYTASAPATYLGTPVGLPGALACATLKANGTLLARIMFEDATAWTTDAGTIAGGAASTWGDANWTRAWPSFTISNGGAGGNVYAAEVGIDSSYDHFNRNGLNPADNLSIIEHSVLCSNVLYLRDAGILHRIGRVVMRGNQMQDPYRTLTGGDLLNETANQWNNVLPPSTHDVAAMLSASSVGGGLGWVGVIGTGNRYSVNDSDANGDFTAVWRHEVGHNWGSNHYEGNTPEGPTIMSGNSLSRISTPELTKIVGHRDTKLAILDNLGGYSFPLPPRASLDSGYVTLGGSTAFSVLANDHDTNGDGISIQSFDATSNLGGAVTLAGGNQLQLQGAGDHGEMDWFNYRIADTTGRTATGIVYAQSEVASTKLTGAGIGTSGTWGGGNTFDKALDGNLSTFYDADSATGDWVGLDLGASNTKVITKVKFAPRSGAEGRMNGGVIQVSNTADFSSGVLTLATITSDPISGVLTSQVVTGNITPYRYVRYLGPANGWCNIAEIEFWGANNVTTKLAGTGIGTSGTWSGDATFDKALDGNLSTYYDADSATGDWTGLDLGAGNTAVVAKVKYAARSGYESRMVGGVIQASTTADFSSGVVTLVTISTAPPSGGALQTVTLPGNSTPYRYYRYLGPTNGFCNIAEVEFWGHAAAAAPPAPTGLTATALKSPGRRIQLAWNASAGATSYNIKRATVSGGPYTTVATATGTSYINTGLTTGTTYYYVVTAVSSAGESGNSNQASATAK